MAEKRLKPGQLDEIAQIVRLGLGLFLLNNAWIFYLMMSDPGLTPAFLWDRYGIHDDVAEFLSGMFFEGGLDLKPTTFAAMAFWVQAIGGVFILFGFLTRYIATFFTFALIIVWFVHFADLTPLVLGEGDSKLLAGPISHLKQLGLALMFWVLAALGPGGHSADNKIRASFTLPKPITWNSVALQLRTSLALLFLSAGASGLFFDIDLYLIPAWVLLGVGLMVLFSMSPRFSGALFLSALGWHIFRALKGVSEGQVLADTFFTAAPFIAAGVIFLVFGGGKKFRPHKKLIVQKWGKMHDD